MQEDTFCSTCNRTGYVNGEVCTTCFGQGILPIRYNYAHTFKHIFDAKAKAEAAKVLAEEAAVKAEELNTIFVNLSQTYKVASCIDWTEYQTLGGPNKAKLEILISCGFVDMREGQWARTLLWEIFGAETTTRAALIAMFG